MLPRKGQPGNVRSLLRLLIAGPGFAQQSIHARGTDRDQLVPHHWIKLQVPVALQSGQQDGHKRPQAFPANPVRGLPQDDQRSAHRVIVDTPSAPDRHMDSRVPVTVQ